MSSHLVFLEEKNWKIIELSCHGDLKKEASLCAETFKNSELILHVFAPFLTL